MAVPHSKSLRSHTKTTRSDRHFSPPEVSASPPDNSAAGLSDLPGQSLALTLLNQQILAGNDPLDSILQTITDFALEWTGACGAALAMRKESAIVCRARSGEKAPPLGAQLSRETGISGECLRKRKAQLCRDTENDPRVDLVVCRSQGLRSIAVLPIGEGPGINGILEVFSTEPDFFTGQDIALLQQLAALAELARAAHPEEVLVATVPLVADVHESEIPTDQEPAPAPATEAGAAAASIRPRLLTRGAIGLATVALLALVMWMGWRGVTAWNVKRAATRGAVANVADKAASAGSAVAPVTAATENPAETAEGNIQVDKPSPSRESKLPTGKRHAGEQPVTLAAKVDISPEKKSAKIKSATDHPAKTSQAPATPQATASDRTSVLTSQPPTQSPAADQPTLRADLASQPTIAVALSRRASLPTITPLVSSQGVSGGELVQTVPPVYPTLARTLHIEGTVILSALIMEDGTVRDIKVVGGPEVLSAAAVDAVKKWRYKPYELNGKPIKNQTKIRVDFKF